MKIKIIGYSIKGKKYDVSRSYSRRYRPKYKDDETIINTTLNNKPKINNLKVSEHFWTGKNFNKRGR